MARCDIPIFIDADTGFGNAVNVHFTVQECSASAVAGLQIEDQEAEESGTSAGRRCISLAEAAGGTAPPWRRGTRSIRNS